MSSNLRPTNENNQESKSDDNSDEESEGQSEENRLNSPKKSGKSLPGAVKVMAAVKRKPLPKDLEANFPDLNRNHLLTSGKKPTSTAGSNSYAPKMTRNRGPFVACYILWVALLLSWAIFSLVYVSNLRHKKSICSAQACGEAASSMLRDMDQTIDPCRDFYSFACGSYLRRVRIPDDALFVSRFSEIQELVDTRLRRLLSSHRHPSSSSSSTSSQRQTQASDANHILYDKIYSYYQSCLNISAIEAYGDRILKVDLRTIGSWPLLPDTHPRPGIKWDTTFDLWESIISLHKLGYYYQAIFSFTVGKDKVNNTRNILYIGQGLRGTGDNILRHGSNHNNTRKYLDLMIKASVSFGVPLDDAKVQMRKVLDLEIKLAQATTPLWKLNNSYNKYTYKRLVQLAPSVPWLRLFNGVLRRGDSLLKGHFIVQNPGYIQKATEIIRQTEPETLANYLGWILIIQGINWMGPRWKDLFDDYNNFILGRPKSRPRWKWCLSHAKSRFKLLLSHLYVKHHFSAEAREPVFEMIEYMRLELSSLLNESHWMDEETKLAASRKVKDMMAIVGFKDELLNMTLMTDHYKSLVIVPDNFYQNQKSLIFWQRMKSFSGLDTFNQRGRWDQYSNTFEVNAYHRWTENSLSVTSAILQGGFYHPNRPKYLNFGSIGFLIAHEFMHGFDTVGRLYSNEGNALNWWRNETLIKYHQKTNCFEKQYDRYIVMNGSTASPQDSGQLSPLKVNGRYTLAENIADNGGLILAYQAYQRFLNSDRHQGHPKSRARYSSRPHEDPLLPQMTNYSANQMFWLSFAQTWCRSVRTDYLRYSLNTDQHSPHRIRVLGALQNSEEFAIDFGCKPQGPMNPINKCTIW